MFKMVQLLAASVLALAAFATPASAGINLATDTVEGTLVTTVDETAAASDSILLQTDTCDFGAGTEPCFKVFQGDDVTFDAPCFLSGSNVYCPGSAVIASLGAGNDTWTNDSTVPVVSVVDGGEGDDTFSGGPGIDAFIGGEGNDRLWGREGNDDLDGGNGSDHVRGDEGNDKVTGGAGDDLLERTLGLDNVGSYQGADTYRGGTGYDRLSFQGRNDNLTITLDGAANDGADGEGDDVGSDIEEIRGGFGADTLTGDANANVLIGDYGNDEIHGGAGNDEVNGADESDKVFGDDGDDVVRGGSGADEITGGAGTDTLEADVVGCENLCANGNDKVFARDGVAEAISCGGGADSAVVDHNDITPQDGGQLCESVDRDAAPVDPGPAPCTSNCGPGPGPCTTRCAPDPPVNGSVSVVAAKLRAALRDGLKINVPCPAGPCQVKIRITVAGRGVGVGKATLQTGGGIVLVTFRSKARKALKRLKKVRVNIKVVSTHAGVTTLVRRSFTLRR